MSDEVVDVQAQHVIEFTNHDVPEEKINKDGMNIPDPAFIDETSEEGLKQIKERREEISNLPPFPTEWQEEYKQDDSKGFDDSLKLPVNVTLKQQEMSKLIKKYKKYLRSNLSEIRRLGEENNEG